MPSLEKLERDYGKKKFKIIQVNVGEKPEVVNAFMRNGKYSFTALIDSHGVVNQLYGVFGLPAAFIIDKKGKIVVRSTGYRDWNTKKMRILYDSLLAK